MRIEDDKGADKQELSIISTNVGRGRSNGGMWLDPGRIVNRIVPRVSKRRCVRGRKWLLCIIESINATGFEVLG